MANKTLDKKFERKHKYNVHCSQFITHYEDFKKLGKENYHLAILPEETNSEFNAYWQGRENLDDKTQKVYLQINFSEGPISKEKVIEYIFPLKGQIKIADFEIAKQNEFFFD